MTLSKRSILWVAMLTASLGTSAPTQNSPQWVLPVVEARGLRHCIFTSAAARTNVSYFIYLPAIYDAQPHQRFPVLYWLHGSGGGLPGVPAMVDHFDTAIRAGKTPPMLIVFVNGLADSMYCDSKDGRTPMETLIVKELVPNVDAGFRTITNREGRLLEGFSMGGYGAARLGFKYHDLFGSISILAGGPLDLELKGPRATANPKERERILQTAFGGDLEYFKAQSPWMLAEQNADAIRSNTRIRMATGESDSTLKPTASSPRILRCSASRIPSRLCRVSPTTALPSRMPLAMPTGNSTVLPSPRKLLVRPHRSSPGDRSGEIPNQSHLACGP